MNLTKQEQNVLAVVNIKKSRADRIPLEMINNLEDYEHFTEVPELSTSGKIKRDKDGKIKLKKVKKVFKKATGGYTASAKVTKAALKKYTTEVKKSREAEYVKLLDEVNARKSTLDSLTLTGVDVSGFTLKRIKPGKSLSAYIQYDDNNPDLLLQLIAIAEADQTALTEGGPDTGNIELGDSLKELLAQTQYALVLDLDRPYSFLVLDFVTAHKHYGRPVFTPT